MASLRWLPVSYRMFYKILFMVFKSLNGLLPLYLYIFASILQSVATDLRPPSGLWISSRTEQRELHGLL